MSFEGSHTERGDRDRSPRSRTLLPLAVDLGLAAIVIVVELGPVIAGAPPWDRQPFTLADALRLVGISAPLLVRRRYPLAMLAVVVGAYVGSDFLGPALAIAFYSLGAWSRSMLASRVGAILGVSVATTWLVVDRNVAVGPEMFIGIAVFGGAWYLGELSRVRRAYTRMLEQRARQLERDRASAERRAAAAERTRIARDLHDIVAHRVSMMTIQAGAASVVAADDPGAARRAMGTVADTGRQTLSELRRLVDVLRADEDGPSALTPSPGIDGLEVLVNEVKATGIPARLTLLGSPRPLPQSAEVSVYRIVQEALTNVMKHAGARAEADVIVTYAPESIEIEVSDTGVGPIGTGPSGYGLIGIRERVAMFGGHLESGPRPGGGFVVRAQLPIGDVAP